MMSSKVNLEKGIRRMTGVNSLENFKETYEDPPQLLPKS